MTLHGARHIASDLLRIARQLNNTDASKWTPSGLLELIQWAHRLPEPSSTKIPLFKAAVSLSHQRLGDVEWASVAVSVGCKPVYRHLLDSYTVKLREYLPTMTDIDEVRNAVFVLGKLNALDTGVLNQILQSGAMNIDVLRRFCIRDAVSPLTLLDIFPINTIRDLVHETVVGASTLRDLSSCVIVLNRTNTFSLPILEDICRRCVSFLQNHEIPPISGTVADITSIVQGFSAVNFFDTTMDLFLTSYISRHRHDWDLACAGVTWGIYTPHVILARYSRQCKVNNSIMESLIKKDNSILV